MQDTIFNDIKKYFTIAKIHHDLRCALYRHQSFKLKL